MSRVWLGAGGAVATVWLALALVPLSASAATWEVEVLRPAVLAHGGRQIVLDPVQAGGEVFESWVAEASEELPVVPMPDSLAGLLFAGDLNRLPTGVLARLKAEAPGVTWVRYRVSEPEVEERFLASDVTVVEGRIDDYRGCAERVVAIELDVLLLDSTLGSVDRNTISFQSEDEACGSLDRPTPFLTREAHLHVARRQAAETLARQFSPHWTTLTLELERSRKTRRMLRALAKGADVATLAALADSIATAHPGHGPALYNRAVARTALGDLDAAEQSLAAARDDRSRPTYDALSETITELRGWKAELDELGVER